MKKITKRFFPEKTKNTNRTKHFLKVMLLVMSLIGIEGVMGQTTVTVGGGASITCPATPTATWTTPPTGVTFSNWSRGTGVTCGTASTALSGSGFNTANAAASFTANKFYSVTLTAAATHNFTLNSLVWSTAVSSGSANFTVQYVNNGGTLTTFGTAAQTSTSSNTFSGSVTVSAGTSIVLYLIPAGAGTSGATIRWANGSTINVTATRVPPTITNSTLTASTTVLAANSNVFTVTGSNSPTSYAASGLPTGLSINATTGIISGTPATGTAAGSPYTVGLTATNAGGTSPNVNMTLTINKANQTITFAPLSSKVLGDADVSLTATASSGLTVSYATSNSAVASLAGSTLSFVGAGSSTITASQAGNADYNAATSVDQSQVVTAAGLTDQTISFSLASPVTYGASPITLAATASSGLAVSYSSSDPTIASISGSTLTILKVGSVTITASQSGDSSYNPAPNATQNLLINPKALTVTGATASDKVYNGTTAATITGATLSGIVGADNVALSPAGATFASADVATGIVVTTNYTLINSTASNYTVSQPTGLTASITQASQSITFPALAAKTTSDAAFSAGATSATSGVNALAYTSSNTNVATINATTGLITIAGAGTTTITVAQPGNINYTAATNQTQLLTVTLAPVTIYLHNFNTAVTASPYSGLPTSTTGSPTGVFNSNFTSTTSWVSSNSAFTNFGGNSGQSLVIQPAINTTSSITLTLNVASGYQATISSFNFWRQRSTTGPNISSITISGNQVLGNSSVPTTGAFLGATAVSNANNLTGTITIVINLTAPTSASQNLRLDDFTLTGNLTCATPAAPTVSNSTVTYDGAAKSVTATVGASTTVDWYADATGGAALSSGSLTSPTRTNAGTYTFYAEARNTASGCSLVSATRTMVTVTINKANATLSVSNPLVLFSGAAQSATVTGSIAGTVSNIVTGGAATQSALGTYAVTADFLPNDTVNYNTLTGASAGNFVISDTSTWNGTTWSLSLPTATMNAVIAADYGTNNGQINVKNLTVNNGARFTVNAGANGATISGNITNNGFIVVENNGNLIQTATGADANTSGSNATVLVHRNSNPLKRLDYSLWSSPVAPSQTLGAFSSLTTPLRNYIYNPGTNLYNSVGNAGTFATGKGYLIRMPDALPSNPVNTTDYYKGLVTLTYEGAFSGSALNNGDITISTSTDKYNAVGNPYPSTISAAAFLDENDTDGNLYFWRKTNSAGGTAYAVYNADLGSTGNGGFAAPNGTIQVGQGFIVFATRPELRFNNTMRATPSSSTQFFKTKAQAQKSRIWLNLNNADGMINQTLVGYLDGATLAVDKGIDAKSFGDGAIELASSIDGASYTLQGRPAFDATDVVALNFKTNVAGTYNIAIDKVDGVFANGQTIVYLVDKTTGIATNLNEGAYTFTAQAGVDNTRFTLTYQKTLKVDAPLFNENSVLVSRNNGTLNVKSAVVAINNVKVFDVQGRLVAERKNVKSNTANISNLRTNQVLIVKVTAENNAVVTKKVLN